MPGDHRGRRRRSARGACRSAPRAPSAWSPVPSGVGHDGRGQGPPAQLPGAGELIRRLALIALLVMAGRSNASAQRVVLRDPGLGTDPRILAGVLTTSYVVIPPAAEPIVLPRNTTYGSSVVILGRDARVASRVHGDVIVVSGNLFIQPGAQIDGRAIAYGGGVYNSTLAVTGQRLSFRDFTYDIVPIPEGFALVYRPTRIAEFPTVTWPVFYGFAMPLYDRSNGLSLAFGPVASLLDRTLELRPRLTYRSQLGAFDARI